MQWQRGGRGGGAPGTQEGTDKQGKIVWSRQGRARAGETEGFLCGRYKARGILGRLAAPSSITAQAVTDKNGEGCRALRLPISSVFESILRTHLRKGSGTTHPLLVHNLDRGTSVATFSATQIQRRTVLSRGHAYAVER